MPVSHEQRSEWIRATLEWCHKEKIVFTTPNAIQKIESAIMRDLLLGKQAAHAMAKQVMDLLQAEVQEKNHHVEKIQV